MKHQRLLALAALATIPAATLAACGSNSNDRATTPYGMHGDKPGLQGADSSRRGDHMDDMRGDGRMQGTTPPGGRPDFGSPASASETKKATKAATAKYPGDAERVMKLSDGSFVVHVITKTGEQHVKVSKAYKVTGLDTRGPGGPGMGGGQPPAGTTPPAGMQQQ